MIRRALGAALIAALATVQAAAQTQSSTGFCFAYSLPKQYWTAGFNTPMHYELLERNGLRILLAEGGIKSGESDRLRAALDANGQVDEVWFNSPGGAASEGPKMGRILRARGSMVRLTADHACVSACSYAFLGGMVRIVDPGAYYGIHMFHSVDTEQMLKLLMAAVKVLSERAAALKKGGNVDELNDKAAEDYAENMRDVEQDAAVTASIRARYLVEMSLSLDFMTDAFGTSSAQECYLNAQGLARYNVSNAR